jgi:hypothetical protein
MHDRIDIRFLVFLCLPFVAQAHVVSMSTGEIRVDGPTAVYELRMPMYEVTPIRNPEATLLDHIRFAGGHRTKSSCQQEDSMYVCTANYEFPALLPDKLDVECAFFQVTVPNHIHLLTATQGKNEDQAVFDQRPTQAELRFHPPSPGEILLRDGTAGAWRMLTSWAGLLLLFGLAIAARSLKEAAALTGLLFMVEWVAPFVAPLIPVTFSARFLESALALAVAYLAVELLFLPGGSGRWIAVVAAGLVEGLMFAGFPRAYLTGAGVIQVAGIAVFAVGALRLPRWRRGLAALMLALALARFGAALWAAR